MEKTTTPATFHCPLCEQQVPERNLYPHIPKCYILYCERNFTVPLCTCKSCKGAMTHIPEFPQFTTNNNALLPLPVKREAPTPVEDLTITKVVKRNPEQSMGKMCLVCRGKKPSNSPLPTFHLGKYRKYFICKKGHLTNDAEALEVTKFLDKEAFLLSTSGDTKTNVMASSDNEEENHVGPLTHLCKGYKSEEGAVCLEDASFL